LAILGGGLAAGRLPLSILGIAGWTPGRVEGAFVALPVGIGLAVSLLHLGRRSRMLQALRRTGCSALSTEVALAGLTASAASAFCVLPITDRYVGLASLLWSVTALFSLALLFAIAWVYRLPGQLSWGVTAAPSPVVLGLAFGMLARIQPEYENVRPTAAIATIFVLLAADGFLYVLRWLSLEQRPDSGVPAHARFFKARRLVLYARLLLAPALPLFAILFDAYGAAEALLAFGIATDRFAFYALALRQTTEAEVVRIERLIKNSDRITGKSRDPVLP
jgi:DMSO reductase anchor subunit